jgi:repressor LexA
MKGVFIMTINERFKHVRKHFRLTQTDFAKTIGISQGNVSDIENGKFIPSTDAVVSVVKHFNVSFEWLLTESGPGPGESTPNRIPVFSHIIAGVEILDNNIAESFIQPPEGVQADFACRVIDDSMKYIGISNGDILFFRRTETAETGQIIAVHQMNVTDKIKLQFFIKKNGQACLRSANPNYEDILLTPHHRIDGVLVAILKNQIPSLTDYENFLYHKNEAANTWSEITTLAITNGIPAKFVKQLIEMQITLSQNLPKYNEKE